MAEMTTIKITLDALKDLRLIAASTGEKQYEVLDRLLASEWARIGPVIVAVTPGGGAGRRPQPTNIHIGDFHGKE